MSDIVLNHEPINQAVAEMNQAAQNMQSTFDQMMQQIRSVSDSFKGAAAEAFQQMYQNHSALSQNLGESFGSGGATLGNMHEEINSSDNRGASILQR